MYLVKDLYEQHSKYLNLELLAGKSGMHRRIKVPEAQRPGLGLSGYLKNHANKRILLFGKVEIEYIKELEPQIRIERLKALINEHTPAVIIARRYRPPGELAAICEKGNIPLFRTSLPTMNLFSRLTFLLNEEFAPATCCHGTLMEIFGVGMLIQGDPAAGKSEAALGLIEKGHRLISDDIVKVKMKAGSYLEGSSSDLTRHHMEIRGVGIINVASLYGAICVRNRKSINIAVRLKNWHDSHLSDRVGLEEKFTSILNIKLPYFELPVAPGRNVVLLLETIALHYLAKDMGYHAAQAFSHKLLELTTLKEVYNPQTTEHS